MPGERYGASHKNNAVFKHWASFPGIDIAQFCCKDTERQKRSWNNHYMRREAFAMEKRSTF
jgi:hypothetical protein